MNNDDSDVSSLDTHFKEHEDDAETLWEVEAIVAERGKKYQVRWAGVDDNGKPWPLDWVPKEDCTDPLVLKWKREKAEKKKRRVSNPIQSRGSTASTTTKVSGGSSSTVTHGTSLRQRKSKPTPAVAGTKRKNDERDQEPTSSKVAQESVLETVTSGRPRKKRKLVVELTSPGISTTPKAYKKEIDTNRRRVKLRPGKSRLYYESSSEDELPTPQPTILSPISMRSVDTTSNSTRLAPPKGSREPVREEESIALPAQLSRKSRTSGLKKSKLNKLSANPRIQPSRSTNTRDRTPHSPLLSRVSRSSASATDRPALLLQPRPQAPPKSSRHTTPLFLPGSPHSTSIPLQPTEGEDVDGNEDVLTSRDSEGEQDEDSALEYVDYPLPEPHSSSAKPPPHAQAQPSKSSSSSTSLPPVSPVVSRGKGRMLEPEVVPETEAEESQESHQHDLEITRSPSKTSLVSKMKPRTPGSKRNILDADIIASPLPSGRPKSVSPRPQPQQKKPLRPIPQISPSKFANLPSSTVESVETAGGGDESSIEQFDSPNKSHRPAKRLTPQEATESSVDDSLSAPPAATDVIGKGVALAEAVKRSKRNGIFTQAKLPLETIIEKERVRSSNVESVEKGTNKVEQKVISPTLEEFADSFVDYEGGMSGSPKGDSSRTQDTSKNVASLQAQVFLRQEEEENTQDLLVDLKQRPVPDAEEGWAYPIVTPDSQVLVPSGSEEALNAIDSMEVAPKSSGPLPETSQEESAQPGLHTQPSPTKRSPSRSLDSSLVPPTTSPSRPQEESILPSQIVSNQGGNNQHLDSAMNLLNKKSEEIARLENLLASARSVIEAFEAERVIRDDTAACWQEERARILEENKAIQESLKAEKSRAEFAEKNAEVFREQYLRVSSFVDDLRTQNAELQERAEVAESQASTGIASVRTMYEMRVQQLEEEATYHKQVTTFLIEQGQRTQDNEIRRRAAEHPELERRCTELETKHSDLEDMLDGARGMIDVLEKLATTKDKENEALKAEKRTKQEETERLRGELEDSQREVERLRGERELNAFESEIVPVPNGVSTTAITGQEKLDGEINVFRCLWRKDGTEKCEAVFLSQEALKQHLELGGHIQ